jgi:hypothetical protein
MQSGLPGFYHDPSPTRPFIFSLDRVRHDQCHAGSPANPVGSNNRARPGLHFGCCSDGVNGAGVCYGRIDSCGIAVKLNRDISRWAALNPEAIAAGSQAQVICALSDAQHDILALAAEIGRMNVALRRKRQDTGVGV